ncbi:hypothetical protein, partial [uncultured Sphingomonas sp.]|uniref:hypothetical protein n=1 Tax=uncultured Sphingomonas sp. TaxID=158754 RepID=UPI0025E7977F
GLVFGAKSMAACICRFETIAPNAGRASSEFRLPLSTHPGHMGEMSGFDPLRTLAVAGRPLGKAHKMLMTVARDWATRVS